MAVAAGASRVGAKSDRRAPIRRSDGATLRLRRAGRLVERDLPCDYYWRGLLYPEDRRSERWREARRMDRGEDHAPHLVPALAGPRGGGAAAGRHPVGPSPSPRSAPLPPRSADLALPPHLRPPTAPRASQPVRACLCGSVARPGRVVRPSWRAGRCSALVPDASKAFRLDLGSYRMFCLRIS
jgi:hypothetical protein